MNKNYIFAGIGVAVIAIIVLVMMNTHPSLAEIVENKDCQELGKFDQRMDEMYGYDVKKAKANENISDELFSKARSLGIDCAFDAVKSMHSDNTSDEYDSKSDSEVIYEAAEIIKERDCKQFVEWYKNNTRYIRDIYFIDEKDLDSYHKYCKDPDTVLDENGIDVEEKWSMHKGDTQYDKWDRKYRYYYLSEIEETLKNSKSDSEVIYEAAEIIKKRDCKEFLEWHMDNMDHVDVLDSPMDSVYLNDYSRYCKEYATLDDNGIDIEEKWSYYSKWDGR